MNRPFGVTQREDQILRLVALELPNRTIAEALRLSPETIRVHIKNAGARVQKSGKMLIAKEYLRHAGEDELTQIWVKRVVGNIRSAALVIEKASQESETDAHRPTSSGTPQVAQTQAAQTIGASSPPPRALAAFMDGGLDDLTPIARLQVAGTLTFRLLGWAALGIIVVGVLINLLEPILQSAPNPQWRGARPALESRK